LQKIFFLFIFIIYNINKKKNLQRIYNVENDTKYHSQRVLQIYVIRKSCDRRHCRRRNANLLGLQTARTQPRKPSQKNKQLAALLPMLPMSARIGVEKKIAV